MACRLSDGNNWHLWLFCTNTRLLLQFHRAAGNPEFSHTVYISISTCVALDYYQALVATLVLGEQFQTISSNSSIKWGEYCKFLTVDVKVDSVLGVLDAVHDLTAISSRIARTELDHRQWGVAYVLRMTGHRHSIPVAWTDFDHSVLGHEHRGFSVSFYFGPFDPQVISAVNRRSIGTEGWRGSRNGVEETGKIHLPRQGASHRPHYGQRAGGWGERPHAGYPSTALCGPFQNTSLLWLLSYNQMPPLCFKRTWSPHLHWLGTAPSFTQLFFFF